MSVSAVVAIALASLFVGGGGGFLLGHRSAPSEVAAAVAPALTEAQTSLAVAQLPAVQVACAAAMSSAPPPCAREECAFALVVQGGQQAQGFAGLDATGISQALQTCMSRQP